MSKIKMRCITCGKWFQSANAKEVTCPDCTQKARKEKTASKNTPPATHKPAISAGSGKPARSLAQPKQKQHQGGTNQWLDKLEDVKVGEPEQPVLRPKPTLPREVRDRHQEASHPGQELRNRRDSHDTHGDYERRGESRDYHTQREIRGGSGPGNYANRTPYQDRDRTGGPRHFGGQHTPSNYRPVGEREVQQSPYQRSEGYRPRSSSDATGRSGFHKPYGRPAGGPQGPGQGPAKGAPRPKGKPRNTRPVAPPKPKREKTPPPQPFVPTPEQIKQVEERYLELAQPAEFDGIRTQIAHELSIPKRAVKQIIKDLRTRNEIPSWWELQTYKGSTEELERIKSAYAPYLPIPPVGVHKLLSDQLAIKPGVIYQAIKAIRQELNLPQYNDPSLHTEELEKIKQETQSRQKDRQEAQQAANHPTEDTTSEPESAVTVPTEKIPTSSNEVA